MTWIYRLLLLLTLAALFARHFFGPRRGHYSIASPAQESGEESDSQGYV